MTSFDRSRLTAYSSRILDRFLLAFPNEKIYSIDNSENYFRPDGDRLKGAWIIEWLCPAGGYDWNICLRSTNEGHDEQLTISWGNDHFHFGYWANTKPDEEVNDCLKYLTEIMQERIWSVSFYNEKGYLHAQICRANEIQYLKASYQASCYKIKSWRGTYDQTILK